MDVKPINKEGRLIGPFGGAKSGIVFVQCAECGCVQEIRDENIDQISDPEAEKIFRKLGWSVCPTYCPIHKKQELYRVEMALGQHKLQEQQHVEEIRKLENRKDRINKEDNEMVKKRIRIWVDSYIKKDEHGHSIRVQGHWKTVEIEGGKPLRFPYKEENSKKRK
jgi:hypothetical protein